MIPLKILYDEYNDRRNLTEKKPSWVYSSSLTKVGRNNKMKTKKTSSTIFFLAFWELCNEI